MSPKDYLINKIDELLNSCSDVCIRYAYEDITEFHVIEVSPEYIRRGNDTYMEWERSLWREFAGLYPDEDLLISEVNDSNDMSNLIYSYNGVDFIKKSQKVCMSFEMDFGLLCGDANYSLAA